MKRVFAVNTITTLAALGLVLAAAPSALAATNKKKNAPTVPTATVPARAAVALSETNSEAQCLEVLQSNASLTEKDAACARLKIVGTDRCVPALAALLADEQLTHSARYALEPMSSSVAGQALIAALDRTTGLIKAGIISSLGVRREKAAVSALGKALVDSDAAVASVAATALGEIGGSEALASLRPAFGKSAGPLHRAVADAILRCGQNFLAAGQTSEARAVFQELYAGPQDDAVQVAAFRGVLLSSGKTAVNLMAGAIAGKPSPAQTAALQLVHELDVPGATAVFAGLLPQVEPSLQAALIDGLSQRNDPVAAPAILALANSPAPEVRLAAINALAILGDAAAIPVLAEAAASAAGAQTTLRDAARAALTQLRPGVPLKTWLNLLTTAKPSVQPELARALGARGERGAIPKLMTLAAEDNETARRAAFLALAQLADQEHLPALVRLVREAKTDSARADAAEALNSACQRIQTQRGRVDVTPLVQGLAGASVEARAALLPVCAGFNEAQVRTALRAAVADANPQVRAAGIRAVCGTLDAELLPDLVTLARTVSEKSFRSLAFSGCVRLATQEESVKLPNVQRVEALKSLLAADPSADEKRAILAGLADITDVAALKLAEPMVQDAAVQNEAARAVIKIAPLLPDKAASAAALKKVVASTPEGPTRQAAETALKQIGNGGGFVTRWQVSGPYEQSGRDYAGLFDVQFAPEKISPRRPAAWRELKSGTDAKRPWLMDLLNALGKREECVAYARTWIHSGVQQPARLELGSDDGIKVWLNDKEVFAHNVARPVQAGAEKVDVILNSGWNLLLLKITQHNQGWAFCARVTGPDGAPLEGLQVDLRERAAPAAEASATAPAPAPRVQAPLPKPDGTFRKTQLTDQFWAEGADLGDFNRDGKMDVVSGPFWYEGPNFKKRHEIWPATNSFKIKKSDGTEATIPGFEGGLGEKNAYSECFLTFTYDFNGDGWADVLVIGFPAKPAYWYENPKGAAGPWPRHLVFDEVGNESPTFADITGDGKPEILCCARGTLGYAEADWKNPSAPWTFHPITPKGPYQKFTHGVGCGDINGDGRMDIIEKDGWWEQPASCQGDPVWVKHPFEFAKAAAQLLVYDVNGDGLNDVITCLNAHGYGLAWYEQARTNASITFRQHLVLNPNATPDRYGISFTQPHALALADMNGDGLMDFVTGKRFWAHGKNGPDPESDGYPAVLYWFELKRPVAGQAEFVPHLIDGDSGVGTQVTVGLIGNRKLPGVVVGNKKGLFVLDRKPAPENQLP